MVVQGEVAGRVAGWMDIINPTQLGYIYTHYIIYIYIYVIDGSHCVEKLINSFSFPFRFLHLVFLFLFPFFSLYCVPVV